MSTEPSHLKELFSAPKRLLRSPIWDGSKDPRRFHFCVPLSIDGTYPEGFQLRAKANKSHFDRDIMFQIEVAPPGSKVEQIARLEWRPFEGHFNVNRGPQELRMQQIDGTHYHAFDLNYFDLENRMLKPNLPIARPIEPDLNDFQQVLAFVGEEFRILDMELVQPPDWTADLFSV